MTKYELAKQHAEASWNDEAYSKAEEKGFVFTIREQKEMSKEDFIAGFNAAMEEWDNIPRTMWVWDNDAKARLKMTVVYIIASECNFPVVALGENGNIYRYRHCAEIEKQRRMTNKELSRWLREKPTREFKYSSSISCSVHSTYTYNEDGGEEEVSKDVVIREDDGEWREPLVEVEE